MPELILRRMRFAILVNTCVTFEAFIAEVSRKTRPLLFAKLEASCKETCLLR